MKRIIPFLCLLLLILASCDKSIIPDNKPNLRELSVTEQSVSTANNDFAFNLFRKAHQEAENENIFFSPLSVTIGLAMTMNGASDETRQSILNVLQFNNTSPTDVNQACKDLTTLLTSMDRTVQIGLANSVWTNQNFTVQKSFSDIISQYYDGKVQALNFSDQSSVNTINSWIESKTNHLIKKMVSSTNPDDAMFLVNAIYFKGSWKNPFENSQTHPAPFFAEDGASHSVTTMHSKESKILFFQNDNFMLVDIPYGNEQFSMSILMPTGNYSVNSLTSILKQDSLEKWLDHSVSISPQLELPKFKMNWKKELKNVLSGMGMKLTGFPHLFEEPLSLEITSVLHQSYVDVNEQGTEAAAATTVTIGVTSVGPPPVIKINRPFVYLIREKHTNATLFMGQMFSPESN
ncbi:serpin [Cytophagales bacterium WSM2-2]|nr:serpin [Cytophagales bacterium WSM2-2]